MLVSGLPRHRFLLVRKSTSWGCGGTLLRRKLPFLHQHGNGYPGAIPPDEAYSQYHEISIEDRWAPFRFGSAWSASHRDHPAIKRAICLMPLPKLERMVLIRFQGLHPPWVSTAEWEFLMWFSLARERDRSWAATWQHTDPRHPCYNGARAMLAPEPVIVECSGLGGGDLQLAQQWHVCIKTNKHNQRIYGPSMALVEESIRLPDKSMIHLTGLGLTKSLQEFLVLQYYAIQIVRAAGILF